MEDDIDLSFPAGASVNDFIPDVEVGVKYAPGNTRQLTMRLVSS